MLRDGSHVRPSHLCKRSVDPGPEGWENRWETHFKNLDILLHGSVQIDVVGADTSCNTELEVFRLLHEVGREVAGVERSRDQNIRLERSRFVICHSREMGYKAYIDDMFLEVTIGAFFRARHLAESSRIPHGKDSLKTYHIFVAKSLKVGSQAELREIAKRMLRQI